MSEQDVAMTEPDDRRSAERYAEKLEVTYSLLADEDATPILFHDTETLDISRAGVRMQLGEEVSAGTLVQICLRVPTLKSPILMMGKIRWSGKIGEGTYQVGIQFFGFLPPGLEQILEQLNRLRTGATGPAPA